MAQKLQLHPKLRIFADRKATVVKNYRVYTTGSATDHLYLKFRLAIPATYLVNTEGVIVWRYIGSREDRPSIQLLNRIIKEKL